MESKTSPRRRESSMSKSSRGRDSVICAMEPNSFRPMLVTIFGDYTLAYLSSTSRENYLALWGPESHMGVTTELSVEDAKFCKNLCSGVVLALSLRVGYVFGVNRYTIHVSCADSIERWTLNDAGSILEYGSRQLETPIEKFFVDQTGDIMVSFEDTFLVLRDRDLQAFNIYRVGSEIPAAATIVQDKEKYLIVCYESCLVKGWAITQSDPEHCQHQPLFSIKVTSSSALCSIVEVLNNDRLYQRRFCVASKDGQLVLLDWSMKDLSLCTEVRVADLRKLIRVTSQKNSKEQTPSPGYIISAAAPSNLSMAKAGRRRSTVDVGLANMLNSGGVPPSPFNPTSGSQVFVKDDRCADTAKALKKVSPVITVSAMCSTPDISYTEIKPACDGADQKSCAHRPAVSIVLTNGTVLCVDIETVTILSSQSSDSLQQVFGAKACVISTGHPVTSSGITSASVVSKLGGHFLTPFDEDDGKGMASDSSREDFDSEDENTSRSRPPSSRQQRPSSATSQHRLNSVSSMRRTSNMVGGGQRRSTAQIIAERRRKQQLATQVMPNLENFVLVSIAAVLGAFDRRIMVFRTYLPRLIPLTVPVVAETPDNNTNASESTGVDDTNTYQPHEEVKFGSASLRPSRSMIDSKAEVSRLPKWALQENSSSESLADDAIESERSVGYEDRAYHGMTDTPPPDGAPLSFFTTSRSPYPYNSPLHNPSALNAESLSTRGKFQDSSKSGVARGVANRCMSGGRGDWEQPGKTKKGDLVDLPVTFHCRVKSSGYGKADVQNNRWKQTKQGGSSGAALRSKSAPRASRGTDRTTVGSRLRVYPKDCGYLCVHQPFNDYPPKVSNIPLVPNLNIRFKEDGSLIGLVSGGNSVGTLKTPISRYKGEGLYYLGHDAQITDMGFAHKECLLITSSQDGSARIWKMGKVDSCAVEISHKYHNPRVGETPNGKSVSHTGTTSHTKRPNKSSRNKPFGGAITGASFYYMDQFALVTTKSSVLMYTYDLDEFETTNDLKRLHATGKYKLAHEWNFRTAQSVTAFSCINSVASPIVLAATTDRCLNVLDAVTGNISRSINGAHERNISCIALPQPSVHVPLPQGAFNVFATSAPDNVIMLWDVRSPSCVARYTDHVNRREKIQCALSPCMRYVATGSEDRTARIFDIVSGRELYRLSGVHRDVVSSVAFHPIHPQLVTASYDGTLKCFTCEV